MDKTKKTYSPVQEVFVEEYLANGFSATKAYRATHPDASPEVARKNAAAFKKKVQNLIDERMVEILGEKEEIANQVLLQLKDMAFSDKRDEIYNASIKLKAMDLMQKQLALQTQKVDATNSNTITINIVDENAKEDDTNADQSEHFKE